jgi:DNA-directed RNA polymerase beta' subunit
VEEEIQEEEIQNILRKQNNIDKAIAANVEAITKIEKEIINFTQKTQNDVTKIQTSEVGVVKKAKKCRYFNRGYCKY